MVFPWAQQYEAKHPFVRWIDERLPLPRIVYNSIGCRYPVPRNFWNLLASLSAWR